MPFFNIWISLQIYQSWRYSTCSLFDLQKAFDSEQYSLLLKQAYNSWHLWGTWRLLKSWYNLQKCMVMVNGQPPQPLRIQRWVFRFITFFLLITDHLLREPESSSPGPTVTNTYAGAFAHAEDIRTVPSSREFLDRQICTIEELAKRNAFRAGSQYARGLLNTQSCVQSQCDVPVQTVRNIHGNANRTFTWNHKLRPFIKELQPK